MTAIVEEMLAGEKRPTGAADLMLQAAEWAASALHGSTGRGRSDRPRRGRGSARPSPANWPRRRSRRPASASPSTRRSRTRLTSRGALRALSPARTSAPRGSRPDQKMVELPRPAGVVFALTPSTNPVCTRLLQDPDGAGDAQRHRHLAASDGQGLLGRGAAKLMAEAAEKAGAPAGIIQVIEQPTLPLIEHVMKSPTDRRDPGDRRHADGACRLQLRQSGDRRRPGQCAGSGRRQRRPRRSRQAHRRLEELRQLDPLHQ